MKAILCTFAKNFNERPKEPFKKQSLRDISEISWKLLKLLFIKIFQKSHGKIENI